MVHSIFHPDEAIAFVMHPFPLSKMKQKIFPQIVEMLGVFKFAAKAVFGKGFPDPYRPMNLGAVQIVQGKLDLSRVVNFDKGLFLGFKSDAVAGEVHDHSGVLLSVLDEHPFKVDFLAEDPPSF